MKNIILFISTLFCLSLHAQKTLREVTFKAPKSKDWNSSLLTDSSYWPIFKRKQIGTWTFINKIDKRKMLKFIVFSYSEKDESLFAEATNSYYMLSSCINLASKRQESNFTSFIKEGYFFLMNMCPCSTEKSVECRKLAQALYPWTIK